MDDRRGIPPGEWNPGSLHQHFTTRFGDLEKRLDHLLADFQGQLDRRIEVQSRERKDTERHLESLIEATRSAFQRQFDDLREAINKTEKYTDAKLADLNRVREQALQDRGMYATKEAVDTKLDAVNSRVDSLDHSVTASLAQKQGVQVYRDRRQQTFQPWQIWLAGVLVTFLLTAVVIVVNLVIGGS